MCVSLLSELSQPTVQVSVGADVHPAYYTSSRPCGYVDEAGHCGGAAHGRVRVLVTAFRCVVAQVAAGRC